MRLRIEASQKCLRVAEKGKEELWESFTSLMRAVGFQPEVGDLSEGAAAAYSRDIEPELFERILGRVTSAFNHLPGHTVSVDRLKQDEKGEVTVRLDRGELEL